jgi:hypothetical protein
MKIGELHAAQQSFVSLGSQEDYAKFEIPKAYVKRDFAMRCDILYARFKDGEGLGGGGGARYILNNAFN